MACRTVRFDRDQETILITIDPHPFEFKRVPARLPFRPETILRPREEGDETGRKRLIISGLVHEADHQDIVRLLVDDDGSDESF